MSTIELLPNRASNSSPTGADGGDGQRGIRFHNNSDSDDDAASPTHVASPSHPSNAGRSSSSPVGLLSPSAQMTKELQSDYADIDEGRVALLLSAASRNDPERVLQLITSGIPPSVSDYDRRTALHIAASDNFYDVVKVLIEEGANINSTDRFGHTPLDEAVTNGNQEIVDLFRYYNASHGALDHLEQKLINASANNNLADANQLLQSGVSPNCSVYDRRTPLHLAVAEGNIELAKLLLKYGANPDIEDRWGLSPRADALRRAARTGIDPMRDLLVPASVNHSTFFSSFFFLYGSFEIALIILMGIFAKYDDLAAGMIPPEDGQLEFNSRYTAFTNVHVMIFIGFAYLMVFLRKHGYTSVGVTFLIGALILQWYPLVQGFWEGALAGNFEKIHFNLISLITGDFCAGSILITFGVVLGKVSPSQMLLIAIFETIFYALNERIAFYLGVADIGGTMVIHMFGAYFGITLSICLEKKGATSHSENSAVYHSDLLAMIGTIFLWMYWPSFNGALGTGSTQMRAAINTTLSIAASCVTTFLSSHLLRGHKKFYMVDIQNATLAGGVAVGACADLVILPGSAMAIGALAGIISVVGFVKVQPFLEKYIGLHDTCGVHNLHGMPSLFGGFCSVVAATQIGGYGPEQYDLIYFRGHTTQYQALMQLAFIGITLGISISSGIFTSLLCKAPFLNPPKEDVYFEDAPYWEVPELEVPYYFDKRGEISRGAENVPQVMANTKSSPNGLSHRLRLDQQMESKIRALEDQVALLRKQNRSAAMFGELNGTSTPPTSYSIGGSMQFRHQQNGTTVPRQYSAASATSNSYSIPNSPNITGVPSRLEILLDKVLKKLGDQ